MMDAVHNQIKKPVLFLRGKLSPRQFLIILGIIVGLTSGLAAVTLKYLVHVIASFVSFYSAYYQAFFLFALFPLFGILLTVVVVHYILKYNPAKGSAAIVYRIVKKSSVLSPRDSYAHLITSAITVGFGGSVGLESPMVSTGAAIGSNFGASYKLSYKDRTILLACGASAGIAAAFNAPIAGVLFAIEVLLVDVSASAFIPLIISAACGALLSRIILAEGVIISFSLQQPFNYYNVPYYILLGVMAGFISLYYTRTFVWVDSKMSSVTNKWKRALGGGILLFVMMVFFPPLFGEGYDSIKSLADLKATDLIKTSVLYQFILNETYVLVFLGIVVFMKAVAAAVTLGSGGNGGNFAPSLFVGAYLGYVFARVVNNIGLARIPESNFTIVAMAGVLSGVFYAPLTAIFLIAEITGGYELMIPLMIVASLSIILVHIFEPLSMEGKKLSVMHNLIVESRDKFLLSKLDLSDLIEKNFSVVHPEETLQQLIKVISFSNRNIFPVVDSDDTLIGIINMNNIRSIIFDQNRNENITVKDLAAKPDAVIQISENLHQVLEKFEDTKQWNLPVVDHGKYVGFLSKSSILSRYRNELLDSV